MIKCSFRRTGNTFQVEMRLFNVRGRGVALGRAYENVTLRNPRAAAHAISDDIHQSQSGLRGVARTKLTFISDRDSERVVDTVETRMGKEVYVWVATARTRSGHGEPAAELTRRGRRTARTSRTGRTPGSTRRSSCRTSIRGRAKRSPTKSPRVHAGVFARRHAHRFHVAAGRQPGNLCDEPQRLWRAAAHQQLFGRLAADLVAGGNRVAFRSDRTGSPQIWVMDAEGST